MGESCGGTIIVLRGLTHGPLVDPGYVSIALQANVSNTGYVDVSCWVAVGRSITEAYAGYVYGMSVSVWLFGSANGVLVAKPLEKCSGVSF